MDIIIFKVMDKFYGTNIRKVYEVIEKVEVTKVANSYDFIEGLFSLRGNLITLFNTYKLLGYSEPIDYNNILIADYKGEKIGLMVEEVSDIINIKEFSVNKLEENIEGITGSIKIRGEIIYVMDVVTLISKEEG